MTLERWRQTRTPYPWRLFRELEETGRQLDSTFGSSLWPSLWRRLPAQEKEWTPAVEVLEKDDRFIIRVELPGVSEEDVDVSLGDGTLTIKGEKKTEHEIADDEYHWSERSFGSFVRTVSLPANVNAEGIGASFEHGILEISLPKVAEVKPKKISITARKK